MPAFLDWATTSSLTGALAEKGKLLSKFQDSVETSVSPGMPALEKEKADRTLCTAGNREEQNASFVEFRT